MTHRCDNCGQHVDKTDFDKGATYESIASGASGEIFEIICIKCNKYFERENAA